MNARNIEDIYPLSPMQQGMLFHTLYAPESGVYVEQMSWSLHGELHLPSFRRAWQQSVDRHAILRTAFVWEDLDEPVQVVFRRVEVPQEEHDWRGLSRDEQQARLEAYLGADQQRGFELAEAPLMRLAYLRLAEDTWHFVWSHHHMLLDGWSVPVLLREVFALYGALSEGEDLRLPPTPPYREYIAWLKQQDLRRAEAFWRKLLHGFTAPTPLDVARSTGSSPDPEEGSAAQAIRLSQATSEALQEVAREHQLTLNTLVQGAWALLLSRYSGERDIVFGVTVSGRPATLPGVEWMVGLFVNTLPVRVQVSPDTWLLPWLQELQTQQVEARQYEFSPLVQVHGWSDVPREQPLFHTILGFENYPVSGPPKKGASGVSTLTRPGDRNDGTKEPRAHSLDLRPGHSISRTNYPISALVVPDETMTLKILYDCRRFDGATIRRMLGHFHTLLVAIAANPRQPLSRLPLLSPTERHALLAWNQTHSPFPRHAAIHHLFQDQAAARPHAPALLWNGHALSYRQLNQQANQLARYLQRRGVGPEVRVGVCTSRSPQMVVGLLGILKAGGAYVPLDPGYPRERLAWMVADAGVAVVLTQAAVRERVPGGVGEIVGLEEAWEAIGGESGEDLGGGGGGESLAYVIYTSGSTGQPKGVAVPHRAVSRLVLNTNYVRLEPSDRVAQISNASFDAATFEIWGALLNGAQLVGIPPEVLLSPPEFAAQIREQGISVLFLTTALFNQLAAEDPSMFRSVRHVLFGGEAVDPRWVRAVLENGPPERLLHVYGPTESTTFASWHRVETVPEEARTVPIGGPVANTQLFVLDHHLQPVPVGVTGELFIGGDGLARGYLNRPDLTAEAFIPDPFSGQSGARLYRTGDLARYREDGQIEYVGRTDHQVKIRGFRVEPDEVKAVLEQHPAVRESIVVARDYERGERRLIAYVVIQPHEPDPEAQGREPQEYAAHLAHWRNAFDEVIYDDVDGPTAAPDPTFNLSGWNSSYTGLPIPAEEMREQIDQAVERILSLQPRSVLEIGCGTGLLLFRIAPTCTRYCGTDFSSVALRYVERQLARLDLPQVTLLKRAADDFVAIPAGAFDMVVLNSVVQYFPSMEYLTRVLEGAVRAVRPGGAVFVGDVRNLRLLEAFHTSVELHRAPPALSTRELRQRVQRRVSQEQELVIDPAFFPALSEALWPIRYRQVELKRGRYHNELTRFRFDVLLQVGGERVPPPDGHCLDWRQQELSLASVRELLRDTRPPHLRILQVPNARVLTEVRALELLAGENGPASVGELREALRPARRGGVDPEDLWDLGRALSYAVEIDCSPSGSPACCDVLFRRRAAVAEQGPEARGHGPEVDFRKVAGSPGQSGSIPAAASGTEGRRSWSSYANDPAQGMFARERVPQLRRFLSERLPEYMMPSAFVLLSGLPLTPNGKVDRGALPAPGPTDLELGRTYVAPRTPAEERMAEIWAAVLGLARVGIHDSFFELGGHSLMATQLVSRVRDAFQVAMPLRQLFETPTIAGLLAAVTERPPGLPDPPIAEIRRTEGEEEQQLLANVEHLSDAEVDALLRELLSEPE